LREKIAGEGYVRLRNRPFLEASMAASALIAMADEHVNAAERLSIESVMENIRRLNVSNHAPRFGFTVSS
jgi:tellurite resistance protein